LRRGRSNRSGLRGLEQRRFPDHTRDRQPDAAPALEQRVLLVKRQLTHLPTPALLGATPHIDARAQMLRIEPHHDRHRRRAFPIRSLLDDTRATPQSRRARRDQRRRIDVGGIGRGELNEDDRHRRWEDTAWKLIAQFDATLGEKDAVAGYLESGSALGKKNLALAKDRIRYCRPGVNYGAGSVETQGWSCSSAHTMEWAIFIALAFVGYMWARRHEAHKKERLDLRAFSHREWFNERMGQDWDADFVDMSLTIEGFSNDYDFQIEDAPAMYSLRRREDGQWQCKMTEASREIAIKELEAKPKSMLTSLNETYATQRKALAQPSKWVAANDEVVGPLESQYHRFVRHYKAS
jgi:hypothetical protein